MIRKKAQRIKQHLKCMYTMLIFKHFMVTLIGVQSVDRQLSIKINYVEKRKQLLFAF